ALGAVDPFVWLIWELNNLPAGEDPEWQGCCRLVDYQISVRVKTDWNVLLNMGSLDNNMIYNLDHVFGSGLHRWQVDDPDTPGMDPGAQYLTVEVVSSSPAGMGLTNPLQVVLPRLDMVFEEQGATSGLSFIGAGITGDPD